VAGWQRACIPTVGMLDPVATHIERYMDLLSARQKLVAANIANADTPGYKTRDLDFQAEFRNATSQTSSPQPAAVEVPGLKVTNDGNNVSLDREARLVAENAMRFHMATELMRSELRTVRSAITEGKNG
jgi:flagellar basal-body rod protein FlgB